MSETDIETRAKSFLDTAAGAFTSREIISGLLAEITRLRAESEWSPIETAKKDGSTYVILRCKRPSHTCVGVFHHNSWKPIHSDHTVHPTHWRPLHSPPKGETP